MGDLPRGTVTFLFTDIEGSTRLVRDLGERFGEVLECHRRLLRTAFAERSGYEFGTEGDAFFVAFPTASDAITAAAAGQRALAAQQWPGDRPLRVRMGLHTGEPGIADGTYVGIDVHHVARICAAGHGGQVLLSQRTRELVKDSPPVGASIRDLGQHRLKDFEQPQHLHQLVMEGLPDEFPPLRTASLGSNLPSPATRFVGRDAELATLRQLVLRDDVRLLTMTGPGGTGKTRLALQAASSLIDSFPDGTWFVPLASVSRPELVALAIITALRLPEVTDQSAVETLRHHLSDKRSLLVLDNFEQITAAASMVAELLAAAPGLKVLATSRSVLHVYGEHEYPVPPLGVPPAGVAADPATAARSEAVALFVQRAEAVQPGFALTEANVAAVVDVCTRLDGLPLAIELAASRVRLLSPQQLARRLENRLQLLTGGADDLPARHRTLRDTIDWSYQLLTSREQRLFRTLSVFVGGCSLEAIEAVAAGDGGDLEILDDVTSLLDKSLLWRDDSEGEQTRFRMLETIRQYAGEQLQSSGEAERLRQAHADYYLGLAQRARQELDMTDQLGALEKFDAEHDNITAALEWSLGDDHPGDDGGALALALVDAMGWFWYTRGHAGVAAMWLERALARGGHAPAQARAKPTYWLAASADQRGEFDRARDLMEESLALLRTTEDRSRIAMALNGVGSVAANQGDVAGSRAAYTESLDLYRELDDDFGIGTVLLGLGELALSDGQPAAAEQLLRESLERLENLDDRWTSAVVRQTLAAALLAQGSIAASRQLLVEAIIAHRRWGERAHLAACLEIAAMLAAAEADAVRAGRLAGAAAALRAAIGAALSDREQQVLDRGLAGVRGGDGAFAAAFAQGQHLSTDQALDEALGLEAPNSL